MASKKEKGLFVFDAYYSDLFGARWPQLKESLLVENKGVGICHSGYPSYYLDSGSVAAACALPLHNAASVLDLCAAPGGKTLVLSKRLNEHTTLVANELSSERRTRLIRVVSEHIPEHIKDRITVTPFDGSVMYKRYKDSFDAVLLDAPCSSERHVLASPSHVAQWTKARIRNLSYTQWSLLSAAFLMLKDGGYVLYSTCALSPDENDGVISKLLKKYTNACIEHIDADILLKGVERITGEETALKPERTNYGLHILPDTSNGSGPLFFCLVKKVNQS